LQDSDLLTQRICIICGKSKLTNRNISYSIISYYIIFDYIILYSIISIFKNIQIWKNVTFEKNRFSQIGSIQYSKWSAENSKHFEPANGFFEKNIEFWYFDRPNFVFWTFFQIRKSVSRFQFINKYWNKANTCIHILSIFHFSIFSKKVCFGRYKLLTQISSFDILSVQNQSCDISSNLKKFKSFSIYQKLLK